MDCSKIIMTIKSSRSVDMTLQNTHTHEKQWRVLVTGSHCQILQCNTQSHPGTTSCKRLMDYLSCTPALCSCVISWYGVGGTHAGPAPTNGQQYRAWAQSWDFYLPATHDPQNVFESLPSCCLPHKCSSQFQWSNLTPVMPFVPWSVTLLGVLLDPHSTEETLSTLAKR